MEFRSFRLVGVTDETADVKSFRLVPADGGPLPQRRPGQYIVARLEGIERSYSLSGPVDAPYLEITMRLAGAFTRKMFGRKAGDEILVAGPAGRFLFDEAALKGDEPVFIAGGVGITPIMCMLACLSAGGAGAPAALVYASRSPKDIIFKERLERTRWPALKLVLAVDKAAPDDGWPGHVGFIDKALIESCVPDPAKGKRYYVCGPPPMVAAVIGALKGLGVPVQNISLEGW